MSSRSRTPRTIEMKSRAFIFAFVLIFLFATPIYTAEKKPAIDPQLREARQVFDCIYKYHVSSPKAEMVLKAGVSRLNSRSKAGKWGIFPYQKAHKAAEKSDWNSLEKILAKYFAAFSAKNKKYGYRAFMSGMTDSLPEGLSEMRWAPDPNLIKARFEAGCGITIGKEIPSDRLMVLSVFKDSPAEKAGIAPGDLIIRINGYDVQPEDPMTELQSRLIGPADTELSLVILRDGKKIEKRLIRKKVDYPFYRIDVPGDKIAVIKFNYFPFSAGDARNKMSKALDSLKESGVRGVILDLRGCADKNYEGAIGFASLFLAGGDTFGAIKRRDDSKEPVVLSYYRKYEIPSVILIDETTRGPAELMAAAICEQRRSPAVGEKSAGAACIQKEWSLVSGDIIDLAVGIFLSPRGMNISSDGFMPTNVVRMPLWKRGTAGDTQMAKAKDLLGKIIRKRKDR